MAPPRFCESCGEPLSEEARFCRGCGRRLEGDPEPCPDPGAFPPEGRVDPAKEVELFDLRPLVLQSFLELALSIGTLGIVAIFLWIRRIQIRYRITSQRIELVEGVFHLKRRTIEVFRVEDLELQEPLFLRLRSGGNLVVRSMDVGEDVVVLTGIPDVLPVFEGLRSTYLSERQRHRVRLLEGM